MISEGPLIGDPDVRALRRVKSSVEHLREVLCSYIDFASAKIDQCAEQLAEERVRRTTMILRHACDRLQRAETHSHEAPLSLFDELMELAFAAVDRQRDEAAVNLAAVSGDD